MEETMESIIIDRKILPEPIISYFHTKKIKISEDYITLANKRIKNVKKSEKTLF
jgi:hypothetical protein